MWPQVKILAEGIRNSRRDSLAKAITLIESSRVEHRDQAALLLQHLAENNPSKAKLPSLRIGVAGPPGAGKSSFIEKLGLRIVGNQKDERNRIAVIPVDPSSHISGGSILGDKTRMEQLSKSLQAYIRASPTRGVLGGIAEHTADVISLCEHANFRTVIVESVGLGQSEVEIDGAVDVLLLIVPPGAGDSLQASKKGIMEAADIVVVNKADGDLLNSAKHTKADYSGSMHFIRSKYDWWRPPVLLMSASTDFNIDTVHNEILRFHNLMIEHGGLQKKRKIQLAQWTQGQYRRLLVQRLESNPLFAAEWNKYRDKAEQEELTPRAAATALLDNVDRR